jgi:hypothetical protein
MEILLENDIQTYDSLLLAIEEEYVEGVELLLEHEERVWHSGTPHSWEVSTLQTFFDLCIPKKTQPTFALKYQLNFCKREF